jgi:NADH-quinone oxidoreductase subunit A
MENLATTHAYFGAFMMFIISISIFSLVLVLYRFISRKIARLNNEKLKTTIYECGPEVSKQENRISTQFYLIALLFILFDVEIIFMFPWAVNFKALGWFGFVEMILFLVILTIGFLYAWKKGALSWHSIK